MKSMAIRFFVVCIVSFCFVYLFAVCYRLLVGVPPPELARMVSIGIALAFAIKVFFIPFGDFLSKRKTEKSKSDSTN